MVSILYWQLLSVLLVLTKISGSKETQRLLRASNDLAETLPPLEAVVKSIKKRIQCRNHSPTLSPSMAVTNLPSSVPTKVSLWSQTGDTLGGSEDNRYFGTSLALSGDGRRLAVGGLGVFYIYERIGNQWLDVNFASQFTTIVHDCAMSSDGNFVVAGETDDGTANVPGRAVVFKFMEPGGWVRNGNVLTDGEPGDLFGWSVDISDAGDKVIIGAPGTKPYVRVATLFDQMNWLTTKIESSVDGFGSSVSLSSDGATAVIGAIEGEGWVTVYDVRGLLGDNRVTINGSGEGFGAVCSLSADGATLVVGTSLGNYFSIFSKSSEGWKNLERDIEGQADGFSFGRSLAVSDDGSRVVVGAKTHRNDVDGDVFGRVYVYSTSPFTFIGVFDSYDIGDYGASVAISGDGKTIAAGGPNMPFADNSSSTGKVKVFQSNEVPT